MERQDLVVAMYHCAGNPSVSYRSIYHDVNSGDYFKDAAVWAYDNNIMRGTNGLLGVGKGILRQDLAIVLYRYAQYKGLNVSARADLNQFSDGSSVSNYAAEAVSWAAAKGIFTGDTLRPLQEANRAETAIMITRFLVNNNL